MNLVTDLGRNAGGQADPCTDTNARMPIDQIGERDLQSLVGFGCIGEVAKTIVKLVDNIEPAAHGQVKSGNGMLPLEAINDFNPTRRDLHT